MLLGLIKPFRPSRHHVKGNSTGLHLIRMLLILLLVLMLHTLAMIYFEGLSLGDSIWLTMTSATTVGYGDLSAKTFAGRFSTILLLYVGGIAILAQVAAMYFEYRSEIRENILTGNCKWKMKNHIVFLNCPHEVGEEYFYKAISGMRKSGASTAKTPIIIVSDKFDDGISTRLRNLNVVHISKPIMNKETLDAANIREAATIIILSTDRFNPISDSINFELVDRLRDMGVKGRIIAEVAQDEHRARIKKVGANNVLRPIRTYPELLMRAILAPGSEQVIETLFDSFGEECIRYEVSVECTWFEIIEKLSSKDLGLPIAYLDSDGHVFTNPSSKKMVKASALFVIVNEGEAKKSKEIEKLLKSS